MKIERLHDWQISTDQARELQRKLAVQVCRSGNVINPRFIAGVDISASNARKMATAAVMVLNYPELKVAEVEIAQGKLEFPYVPGLLSFRESPLTLAACEKLKITPDLFLVDGQGIAHPRRMGLASHIGLLLDRPTIGCAKSRLCGEYGPLKDGAGSWVELTDGGETIGAVVRTREAAGPLYVSIGHRVDLAGAIRWVLACCRGYRIPEPLRLAHLAAGGRLADTG